MLGVYILGSLTLEIARPEDQGRPSHHDEAAATSAPNLNAPDGFPHGTRTDQYIWGLHKVLDGLSREGAA